MSRNLSKIVKTLKPEAERLRRLGQGEILTQIGAGFGLRIMGIIIKN